MIVLYTGLIRLCVPFLSLREPLLHIFMEMSLTE